jgi:hypothetical protein
MRQGKAAAGGPRRAVVRRTPNLYCRVYHVLPLPASAPGAAVSRTHSLASQTLGDSGSPTGQRVAPHPRPGRFRKTGYTQALDAYAAYAFLLQDDTSLMPLKKALDVAEHG